MLELKDIHCGYGKVPVLHGINVEVASGSLTAVMGHNGAGKTTLLRAAIGLIPVRQGAVMFDGVDITALPPHVRARRGIAYVPQGQQGFSHMTTRENLLVVSDVAGKAGGRRTDEALDLFPALRELWGRRAGLLSGGQRQQLAIARAMILGPKVMILDEPTEGIQPTVVAEIHHALRTLTQSGEMSVLLVEQHVGFALAMAQRYVVVDAGRMAASGIGGADQEAAVRRAMALAGDEGSGT